VSADHHADGIEGPPPGGAAVATLLAWTFGLAPALLFVLTWTDEFSPLQQMARAYALPVVAAQLVIIAVSFREGWRLGRPELLPLALVVALAALAWVSAARASLLSPALLRTGICSVQIGFALAVVNLWHHRMLDLEKFRTAILTGLLLVFGMVVVFVETTAHPPRPLVFKLPGFGHVRWLGYCAAAAVGLSAPGFLRSDKVALFTSTIAFTAAFWTGSRGAVGAAVAGFLVCAFLFRDFRAPRAWLLFMLSGLAGLALALGLDALVPLAAQGPDSMARLGSSGRTEMWKDTIGAIGMRPWLGWGEAQFRSIFRDEWSFGQPHNIVLQVLLAWGAVGAVLCGALAACVLPRFVKARGVEAAPFQCAALMLAAYSLVDGSLYYAHSLALFVLCCAAAVAAGSRSGASGGKGDS
jgi:O-antigen ligase